MKVIKNIIFSLILLNLFPLIILANEIDSIKTDEDVNNFMEKHFGDKYINFSVADASTFFRSDNYKLIADTLGMQYWYKTDFNNDGETDLLAYGSVIKGEYTASEIIAVIYLGNNIYQHIDLANNVRNVGALFPVVDTLNSEIIIIRYQTVEDPLRAMRFDSSLVEYRNQINHSRIYHDNFYLYSDTLVYKFDTFIEYNPNLSNEDIIKIEVKNSCGNIACYVMDIQINNDGSATMEAGEYYEEKINYRTHIYEKSLQKIFELINYLEFNKLKNNYSVSHTHASSVSTKVTYTDGKTKQIYDYGRSGTFGLIRLYQLLFELKDNKLWEVVE